MADMSKLSQVRAPEGIRSQIAILREVLLAAQQFDASMWLAAAVSFPCLCESPAGQQAMRRAAAIAWRYRFISVSMWINSELLGKLEPVAAPHDSVAPGPPPVPDFA